MLALALLSLLQVAPEDPASPVHPRRFGVPGGVGVTRGWYLWKGYDPKTGRAEAAHESTGETFGTRVLPWATTYRHLVYGEPVDALRPGERVNLFFNPEGADKRAYLVHMQDEIGQMKGHGHFWQVTAVDGPMFTARGMKGDRPLESDPAVFTIAPDCRFYRDSRPAAGDKLYLTWCREENRRLVHLVADEAGLEKLRADALERERIRVRERGLAGFVEAVDGPRAHFLVFATDWSPARDLKGRQAATLACDGRDVPLRVVSRKNLGAYGSGATEVVLEGLASDSPVRGWTGGRVVRLRPRP